MKNALTLFALLLLVLPLTGQGIDFFHGSWDEAVEEAKKQEKLIFVDGYAEWCGPCKRMSRNVFTDSDVGDFYNKHFINVKMDMEKGEGPKFGQKYPVSAYPTLYYIDFTGDVVLKVKGARQADAFIELGRQALGKIDRTSLYEEAYEKGDRNPGLVYDYIKALNQAGQSSLKVANDYLRDQEDITTDANLKIIHEAAVEADSRLFGLMIEHRKAIEKLVGKEALEAQIMKACHNTVDKAIEFRVESLLEEAKSKMKDHYREEADAFEYEADMEYAKAKRDADAFLKAGKKYAKKIIDKEPAKLHTLAREMEAYFADDENCLEEAEKIAGTAAEQGDRYIYYYTYARLLLRNGNKKDARTAAEKSLKMAKEEGPGAERMVQSLILEIEG